MCGTTTTKRRRSLTHGRQLVLSTLQNHPELAQNMQVSTPECDFDKCTSCGECVNVCPTFACDLVGSGRFALESTYCLGCGACVKVCPEHALKLVEHDASIWSSSIPKPRKRPPRRRRLTKKLEKVKAEAKAKLDKMLDGGVKPGKRRMGGGGAQKKRGKSSQAGHPRNYSTATNRWLAHAALMGLAAVIAAGDRFVE